MHHDNPDWSGDELNSDDDESAPPNLDETEESDAGWEDSDED